MTNTEGNTHTHTWANKAERVGIRSQRGGGSVVVVGWLLYLSHPGVWQSAERRTEQKKIKESKTKEEKSFWNKHQSEKCRHLCRGLLLESWGGHTHTGVRIHVLKHPQGGCRLRRRMLVTSFDGCCGGGRVGGCNRKTCDEYSWTQALLRRVVTQIEPPSSVTYRYL